jgi:hypothetical protein
MPFSESPQAVPSFASVIDGCTNGVDDPRRMDLIRIGIAAAVLWDIAPLHRHAIEIYSTAGPALLVFGQDLEWISPGPLLAVAVHAALVTALALLGAGLQIRISAVLCGLLYYYLGLCDGLVSFKKYSVIAIHVFAILALSPRRTPESDQPFPIWPRRCVQWLLCCIYLGAAITKYLHPQFRSGELMTFTLLDDQWGSVAGWSGEWGRRLAENGQAMAIFSIGTVLLEASLPILLWVPKLRPLMLVLAVLFHLGVDATMNVRIFTPVMLVLLTSFLSDREFALLVAPIDWIRNRLPVWRVSIPVYGAILAAACGVACGVQWWFDWYGVFGRRQFPAPVVLTPVEAARSLTSQQPPPPSHIRQIVLGSREWLDRLVKQHEFQPHEPVRVMIETPPMHPRLSLEFVVHDAADEEVVRFAAVLEARDFRSAVTLEGTETWPAGEYTLTVLADEFEAAVIPFRMLPGHGNRK